MPGSRRDLVLVSCRSYRRPPAGSFASAVAFPVYRRLVLRHEGHHARSLRPGRISRGRLFCLHPQFQIQNFKFQLAPPRPGSRSICRRRHPSHAINTFSQPYGFFELPICQIQDLDGAALGTTHIRACAVGRQRELSWRG